jgi:hypothetical protein
VTGRGLLGQGSGRAGQQGCRGDDAFVVPGLLGQVGEQVTQTGVAEP